MRPRIRTIKPEMFKDERVVQISREARLCRIVFLTMADDEGRFRCRRQEVIGHGYPGDDDAAGLLDGWIAEIKRTKAIVFYIVEKTPYGAFRHWAKHQVINRPSPSELPPPPDPTVVRDNAVMRIETGKGMVWKQHARLTDDELGAAGLLNDDSVNPHSPRAGARSDPDPLVLHLSEKLAGRVRANDPHAKVDPMSDRWLTDMRLLVTDRDGNTDEIERIIDWCQGHHFWRANILSPGKLRKQFTQLVLQAGDGSNVVAFDKRKPNASDLLRKLNEADAAEIGGAA